MLGIFMKEVKTELPQTFLLAADAQTMEALDVHQNEKMVEVFFPSDRNRDYVVTNHDGTITRVAYTVNINGVQWIIPADQKTKIPQGVYEFLAESLNLQEEAIQYQPPKVIGIF